MIGWDEILEGGLPAGATVQSWRGMDGGRDAVAMGHDAIMSPTSHCYFDYPVESTDLEEVYGFEPEPEGLEGSGRILGGECNMWSERAPQRLVESKVYPRLVAMAEVLWSPPTTRNWSNFQSRMESHYTRLDTWEVAYGWETVPMALEWEQGTTSNSLQVQLVPAMSGVEVRENLWLLAVKQRPVPWAWRQPMRSRVRANCGWRCRARRIDGRPVGFSLGRSRRCISTG